MDKEDRERAAGGDASEDRSARDRSGRGRSCSVLAPAKINLRLDVLGRRADGYHELETFLVAVDLCDEIRVNSTRHGEVRLEVRGPHASSDIPIDARNLAVRAAAAVLERARARGIATADTGLDLVLEKRIPSQSGLGGASSDAAAAWLAATSLLDVAIEDGERDGLLATLGSDTVFFARAAATGAAWCTGRGEVVEPARAPGGHAIVLLTPTIPSPTAAVYAAANFPLRAVTPVSTVRRTDWFNTAAHATRALLGNHLEPAAFKAVPALGGWRALLDEHEAAHFRLSGSGSSFFGLYEDQAGAEVVCARIETAARARGLGLRFAGVVRPIGHGARLCRSD